MYCTLTTRQALAKDTKAEEVEPAPERVCRILPVGQTHKGARLCVDSAEVKGIINHSGMLGPEVGRHYRKLVAFELRLKG